MKEYKHRIRFTYNGKRYSVYGDTLKEVYEKKANKLLALKEEPSGSDMTLSMWSEKCFPLYKVGVTDKTYRMVRDRTRREILDHIGSRRLSAITPEVCQYVLNLQQGRSKSYIDKVHNDLRFLMSRAVVDGLITKDPTLHLIKPKGTYTPRRALTEEERTIVEAVIPTDRRYYLFGLMLWCGCRPSEASECKGSDIVKVDGVYMIHVRGRKTALADRFVPIPEELFALIKKVPKSEFLASNTNGLPFTENTRPNLWKSFWRACNRKAGCTTYRNKLLPPYPFPEDLSPYCLRHEYCTNLARLGVDIRTAQKLMGHSTIALTADIYTHVETSALKAAAELLRAQRAT